MNKSFESCACNVQVVVKMEKSLVIKKEAIKKNLAAYVDSFFPNSNENLIIAVKKTDFQRILMHIDLKEKIVSFDCLNKDNKMSYCNLFSQSELENSILEKIEIRKMKSLKNEVMLITESLKLSFSLLIILDDLFN